MSPGPFSIMTCSECGATVAKGELDAHECDPQRRADHQLSKLHPELERFDVDLATWLETPEGRFAQWDAERRRAA
jgi:hypothetical protein